MNQPQPEEISWNHSPISIKSHHKIDHWRIKNRGHLVKKTLKLHKRIPLFSFHYPLFLVILLESSSSKWRFEQMGFWRLESKEASDLRGGGGFRTFSWLFRVDFSSKLCRLHFCGYSGRAFCFHSDGFYGFTLVLKFKLISVRFTLV